jgi:hypothetical protein
MLLAGTSVGVYCIILNSVHNVATEAYYTFSLDGGPNVSYIHNADSSSDILYNVQVFSVSGLANVPHTHDIVPFMYKARRSLMLFDYAEYT